MSLDLSPEIESAVRERAEAEGVSVNDLLARTFPMRDVNCHSSEDPRDRARTLLRKWRAEDDVPVLPGVYTHLEETSTETIFKKWEEKDADLSDDDVDAEKRFWEDYQQGIDETRAASGMRSLF